MTFLFEDRNGNPEYPRYRSAECGIVVTKCCPRVTPIMFQWCMHFAHVFCRCPFMAWIWMPTAVPTPDENHEHCEDRDGNLEYPRYEYADTVWTCWVWHVVMKCCLHMHARYRLCHTYYCSSLYALRARFLLVPLYGMNWMPTAARGRLMIDSTLWNNFSLDNLMTVGSVYKWGVDDDRQKEYV